jgi:hypothetical protein
MKLTFHNKTQTFDISLNSEEGKWLVAILDQVSVHTDNKFTFAQIKADFENHFEDFELFWYSRPINSLLKTHLLIL